MNQSLNKTITRRVLPLLIVVAGLSFSLNAYAATLFTQASQSQVGVGGLVTVQVLVDTSSQVINNVESIIHYPKDSLEVVSIDKTSIFSLWVQEPIFSNSDGELSFNGGVPNPGYQGSNGKIISVVFRAKKVGPASIVILDSAIRANDGLGTDILSDKMGSTINVVSTTAPLPSVDPKTNNVAPPVVNQAAPAAIRITSSSHPDQEVWYNKKDVNLTWSLPKEVTAVKTIIATNPNSKPSVYYDGPILSKAVKDLKDGVWYFNLSYLKSGSWSQVSSFKLKIDTAPPIDLTADTQIDATDNLVINLKATDAGSGLDHFEVLTETGKPMVVKADREGRALTKLPLAGLNEGQVKVTAYDKAGNSTEIKVNPATSNSPVLNLDSYPVNVNLNESIKITGSAPYPYELVKILLKDERGVVETYRIKTDSYSKFDFSSRPMSVAGNYTAWAEMSDASGESTLASDKVGIKVVDPIILQFGSYAINVMSVVVPALALVIVFILMILYGWLKFIKLYKRVKTERDSAEQIVQKSFDILRKEISTHITKLKKAQQKRPLTKEETRFLEKFDQDLKEAGEIIYKEVKKISKK